MVLAWFSFCVVCTYLGYALGVYLQDGEKIERHANISLYCSIVIIWLVAWNIGYFILYFS